MKTPPLDFEPKWITPAITLAAGEITEEEFKAWLRETPPVPERFPIIPL
ncbi:hypothetical protein HZ994_12095 [Akkermansiaceae bacterium]|nr:hypothetical protein HZ994_12095 [Akkermansiaceae bacterium]